MKHVVSNRDCNTINDFEISRDMLEHGKILAFADYDGVWVLSKVGSDGWVFTSFGTAMHYSNIRTIENTIKYIFPILLSHSKDLILFDSITEFFKWALEQST